MSEAIVQENLDYTLFTWSKQANLAPMCVQSTKGTHIQDTNEKWYLDFSAQLSNVNVGHSNPKIIDAIQKQLNKLIYVAPSAAHESRGKLGKALSEIMPGDMTKSFFTLGGADAVENAIKMARMVTGKKKVMSRYRSYHGSTFGAMAASGDPRRHYFDPESSWVIRLHDPYPYRSPIYRNRTPREGDQILIDMMEDTLQLEGPDQIAAILLEGYSGGVGVMAPSTDLYWKGVRDICDHYNILLIDDEILSGFGRTGKWFAVDHYGVVPDLMAMSKGLTSGYVPMGAVGVSQKIASHFDENLLGCGLTYSGHPLACAAAIATIEVYHEEQLVQKAERLGKSLDKMLNNLKDNCKFVGDVRGKGLLYVLELVKDKETKEALSPWNGPLSSEMAWIGQQLKKRGLMSFNRWNMIFITPPLSITEKELEEGVNIITEVLKDLSLKNF